MLDGRYRLIEPIGAGGFGQVWKAHDPNVDRLVAVKVLTGDAGSRRQAASFAREAAVAGGLTHPNIAPVYDFGSATHDGQTCAYLVMELLAGQPLWKPEDCPCRRPCTSLTPWMPLTTRA
ncbi:protein kinase domain-containing protein [Streptomyces sp. BK340]|uniref:protein kinase domain-containing protein n=1 Tax=Streptomyces sp. BK340 TaxID=2572903 RepID=UPI0011ACA868|nr:protein kinase [Streptomyces sp. BK340]TVZ90491.1 protein kinase-like protein [Streptomyces sp. BK340]